MMQEEHHRGMDLLQRQLDSIERDNYRLQRELQHMSQSANGEHKQNEPAEFIQDPREERQQGEVSTDFRNNKNKINFNTVMPVFCF